MRNLIVVLLLVAVVLFGVSIMKESEFRESSYATYEDLRASGTFAGGWVPAWLPTSATRIHNGRDLDTNENLLTFTIAASEAWPIKECTETKSVLNPSDRVRALAGWPPSFDPPHFSTYKCAANGRSGYLAKRDAEIWYWELGR